MTYLLSRMDRDGAEFFVGTKEGREDAEAFCREVVDLGARYAYLKKLGEVGTCYFVHTPFNYDRQSFPLPKPPAT